jgi:DNA-binding HxlR family transcriptional regulator
MCQAHAAARPAGSRIVEADAYALTSDGRDLLKALAPLDAWARPWGS